MNSGYITEAVIARLHHSDPQAIARNAGPRLLRDIETSLHVALEHVQDLAEAFLIMERHGPGTNALLSLVSRERAAGHVVIIVNQDGQPTIIEGQAWGPAYLQNVYTSAAQAAARYGEDAEVGLALIPQP